MTCIKTGLFLLATILFFGGGCTRAVSEGLGVVKGAKGVVVTVTPVSSSSRDVVLEDYTQFEIERFSDSFGRTPPQVFRRLPGEFQAALAKKKIYNRAGGKTLVIRGTVIHFEDSTRTIDQVFGPFEELVARVQLVDKSSGKVLGVANCIGRSTTSVNKGIDEKTEGLAEAIATWISRHYFLEE